MTIPVEAGNQAARAGKLGSTIQSILADSKPEAVYFTDDSGQRTALLFLEMNDASQISAIAEPWFLTLNASIEIHPVMISADLAPGEWRHRGSRQEVQLTAPSTCDEPTFYRRSATWTASSMDKVEIACLAEMPCAT